jgi:hypothetical protein
VLAQSRHLRIVRPASRLLPAVVVVLASALSAGVEASTMKESESFDAASHAAACKCGAKCRGASCCCGSRKPKSAEPRSKTPVVRNPSAEVADNPCLNSAPCSDPILPPSAPVGSYGKVAALGPFEAPPPPGGRRMFPDRSSELPTDRRSSRLDRPPKALASA